MQNVKLKYYCIVIASDRRERGNLTDSEEKK